MDPDILALLNVSLFSLSFLIIVLSILGIYIYWYLNVRLPPTQMVAPYLAQPPEDLSPGAAGMLLGEAPYASLVRAVLLDIARRGGLTVQPSNTGNFTLTYRGQATGLTPMESSLLASLGLTAEGATTSLQSRIFEVEPAVIAGLREELRSKGYIRSSFTEETGVYARPEVRVSLLLLILGIVAALYFIQYTGAGFCLPAAFVVVLIAMLVLDRNRSPLTPAGAQARERWAAFRRYLTSLKTYTETAQAQSLLERYLPFAVAFGIEHRFLNEFEQGSTPAPIWWLPLPQSQPLSQSSPSQIDINIPGRRSATTSSGSGGGSVFVPDVGDVRLPNVTLPSLSDASDRVFQGLGSASNTTFQTLSQASSGVGKIFSSGGSRSSSGGSHSSGSSSSSDNDNDGCFGGIFKAIGGAIAALFAFLGELLKAILSFVVTVFSTLWRAMAAFWVVVWSQFVIYWELLTRYDPVALAILGVAIAVIGSILVFWLWRMGGSKPEPVTLQQVVKSPPDDLAPAAVALLVNPPPANREYGLAFIWLELARRGIVGLTQAGNGLKVTRLEVQAPTTPMERELLAGLNLTSPGATVELGPVANHAEQMAVRRLKQILDHDGYMHLERGRWYRLAAITAIIVTIVVAIATATALHQPFVLLPFAGSLIAAGVLLFLAGRTLGLLPGGALAAAYWQAFVQYLIANQQNAPIKDEYLHYLPAVQPAMANNLQLRWWPAPTLPLRPVPVFSDWEEIVLDLEEAVQGWWMSIPFARQT